MANHGEENTPIYKKWWFWLIIAIVLIAIIGGSQGNNSTQTSTQPENTNNEIVVSTAVSNNGKEEEDTSAPKEYRNALEKAKSYQNTMNMSKNAIYDQLISEYGEKFTAEEAQYAIDNLQ